MLISHRKQFIFIHIYKTVGTSVMEAFISYASLIDRLAYEYRYTQILFQIINHFMGWRDDGMKQITGFHKHVKAHEIKENLRTNFSIPMTSFLFSEILLIFL